MPIEDFLFPERRERRESHRPSKKGPHYIPKASTHYLPGKHISKLPSFLRPAPSDELKNETRQFLKKGRKGGTKRKRTKGGKKK